MKTYRVLFQDPRTKETKVLLIPHESAKEATEQATPVVHERWDWCGTYVDGFPLVQDEDFFA